MNDVIAHFRQESKDVIAHFTNELGSIRAGRATPSIVERIHVDAYGSSSELQHVASISTPDARTIAIQPWDKSMIEPIQSALEKANLGMQPVVQEQRILLTVPALTAERRSELMKMVSKKSEEARMTLRGRRDKAKSVIQSLEKEKSISEDQKFRLQKELQGAVDTANDEISALEVKKEKEISL